MAETPNQVKIIDSIRYGFRHGESIPDLCKKNDIKQARLFYMLKAYQDRPDLKKCICGLPVEHKNKCYRIEQTDMSINELLEIEPTDTVEQKVYKYLYKYYVDMTKYENNFKYYERFDRFRRRFIEGYGLEKYNQAISKFISDENDSTSFIDRFACDMNFENKLGEVLKSIDNSKKFSFDEWEDISPVKPKRRRRRKKQILAEV